MLMPIYMAFSHYKYLRTRDESYLLLTKAWLRGVAILFAVGAVSGTVISFEIGLLWPSFMRLAGPIIGMPFSLEGAAFFSEAIAIGLYVYGWNRMRPWVHWCWGLVVAVSAFMSGIFVVSANAWMNSPSGFEWVNGEALNVNPIRAFLNPAWAEMAIHMMLAAAMATGFAVAGVHAWLWLRKPEHVIHKKALSVVLPITIIATLLQPLSGDFSAKHVAKHQPVKFAAMESLFYTEKGAPLVIGGVPDLEKRTIKYAIKIPHALSVLATGKWNGEVKGLEIVPAQDRPPVTVVHVAFQIMVALGVALLLFSLVLIVWIKRKMPWNARILKALVATIPLGFIALEAGWTVTEVGRQPWVIYNIMRTAEAVTPMTGLWNTFAMFALLYLVLAWVVVVLMIKNFKTL